AFASLSLVGDAIWNWWLLWVFVSVAAALVSPTVWAAAVSGLFHASRGLALAVALSGSGLSIIAVPAVATAMVENFGWRSAYPGIAATWALATLPILYLFFHGATDRAAAVAEAPAAASLPGLTAREGFRSRKYVTLALAACALILV